MKSEWKKIPIKDLCIGFYDGPHATPPKSDSGAVFLGIPNFSNGRLDLSNVRYISEDDLPRWTKRVTPQAHDIVFSYEATLNLYAIIPDGFHGCLGRRMALMRPDESKVNYKFLYYYMFSSEWREEIERHKVFGSTVDRIPLISFPSFMVNLPDMATQEYIANILSALDDKIAFNNKINENLEQQTQALYQKYFPETDNAGKLADLCDFSKDKIAVSELNVKNYFSTENMLPDKKGTTEAANLPAVEQTTACHIGNVLVSNIRPYFKKILYCHCEGGCSTDVLCFVPKILELSAYLYCTLYADKFFDFMVAGSKGTKMPRGDKKQIMTYSVCLPSENELKNFNAAVLPMFQLIESNRRENARLSLLRDTLLPKLMAGEI